MVNLNLLKFYIFNVLPWFLSSFPFFPGQMFGDFVSTHGSKFKHMTIPQHDCPLQIVSAGWFQLHCKIPRNQKLEGKKKVKLFALFGFIEQTCLGPSKIEWDLTNKLRSSYEILRFFRGPFSGSCWRFLGLGSFVQRRFGTQKFPPKTTARS